MNKCYSCKNKAEEGQINISCLECKHAYFETAEVYNKKSDLYEKEKSDDA